MKEVFYEKNDDKMYKAWVTLYTCSSTRAILLDLVPRPNSASFINSFHRMIARRECQNNSISDNGKSFISDETQSFATNLGINWDLNLPLALWHGGFFERLDRSTKTLLKKDLQNYRLSYDEMQTVFFEVEMILNNRPLTYVYSDEIENLYLQITCYLVEHLLQHQIEIHQYNLEHKILLHKVRKLIVLLIIFGIDSTRSTL